MLHALLQGTMNKPVFAMYFSETSYKPEQWNCLSSQSDFTVIMQTQSCTQFRLTDTDQAAEVLAGLSCSDRLNTFPYMALL